MIVYYFPNTLWSSELDRRGTAELSKPSVFVQKHLKSFIYVFYVINYSAWLEKQCYDNGKIVNLSQDMAIVICPSYLLLLITYLLLLTYYLFQPI
jgi:hypothetical protein